MKKLVILLILILPFKNYGQSTNYQKQVLMVVSSYGKDKGKTRPGFEFDELAQAYLVFKNNGLLVDIASPKGGEVEADQYNTDKLYNQLANQDEDFIQKLKNTKRTSDLNADNYDVVYVVGGKGAMFDLPFDPALQDIILNLYNRDYTIISAVCHGPAAFANIKSGEDFIIKDVEMTGFCNIEEDLFGKKWVKEFPFKLEDKLTARGAVFQQADFMLSQVSTSGKFVTGQNPFSTNKSAEAVVKALGLQPVEREFFADERTVYLIQDLLAGNTTQNETKDILAADLTKFDIPLLAAYGYYKILAAQDDPQQIKKGAELVELSLPHFFDENLHYFMAKTYMAMDEKAKSKALLNQLIAKNVLKEQAQELLNELN